MAVSIPVGSASALIASLLAAATPAEPLYTAPLELDVALVTDPEFPALDDAIVKGALASAAATYAERFQVAPPTFKVRSSFTVSDFLITYVGVDNPACKRLFDARYRGRGAEELAPFKERAIRFFQRWSLDALKGFVDEKSRAGVKSYDDIYGVYAKRYVETVDQIKQLKTPAGTPLAAPGKSSHRSHATWICALGQQQDFDVIVTNTFIMADLLDEPHPHAVFGKAKVGGIAAQSLKRPALGGQALLVSTFGIDTPIPTLSELGGKPASLEERSSILGAYLLAHEIAHATFGVPDAFDHPPGCLMTSRPGESYREGLAQLHANPGPCPRCRPYVEARALLDHGRALLAQGEPTQALKELSKASKTTPSVLHGGYKRRISQISLLASEAYEKLGNREKAKQMADNARDLDPKNGDAALRASRLATIPASADRTLTSSAAKTLTQ